MNPDREPLEAAGSTPSEVSLDEAFALAQNMHRAGQLEGARTLYERILDAAPDHADAWHFLGLARYQQHLVEPAIEAVRTSLALAPDYPDAHANLANMLLDCGDPGGAEEHLQRAIALNPQAVPPRLTLAVMRRALGRAAEAETLLLALLEQHPREALIHHAMGHTQAALGRLEPAVRHYSEAVVLDPSLGGSRQRLVFALVALGRMDQALRQLREWMEQEPDNPAPRHLFAACGGAPPPPRAGDDYVRHVFDRFAVSFDAKLADLEYRAPQLLGACVARVLGAPAAVLDVLDAGCGTGLLAAHLRLYARRLCGVDLSPGMLARARSRGSYDELLEAELTAFLRSRPGRYDLVASSDTLCYFGDLEDPAAAAHAALRDQGRFVFTLEHGSAQAETYHLQHHGRYAHRRDYAERVLQQAGFDDVRIATGTLRMEGGKPVAGLIVAARKGT